MNVLSLQLEVIFFGLLCSVVSLFALTHYFLRKKGYFDKSNFNHEELSSLLFGGALFGIVDHWWNNELFLVSQNIASDLALGLTISASITIFWYLINVLKTNPLIQTHNNYKSTTKTD